MKKILSTTALFISTTILSFSQINYVPNVSVSTYAGILKPFSVNGQGTAASFKMPSAIATDASGNSYVADAGNNLIRKITAGGLVTTLAGSGVKGAADGQGVAASFNKPADIAVDISGNVYVADTYNYKIRKISPTGLVSTIAGSGVQGAADGQGTAAKFSLPSGIGVDASGNIYVADGNNDRIRKIDASGLVTTLTSSGAWGTIGGTTTAAGFFAIAGLSVDAVGNIYVCNYNYISKITPAGTISTLAGSGTYGSTDGQGTLASFSQPNDVAIDASGNVYVADFYNQKIRKITPAGLVSTFAGSSTNGNVNGTSARFNYPQGVSVDAAGTVYVADTYNNEIRKITSSGVTSAFAGSATAGNIDGQSTIASFNLPSSVSTDSYGNIYVADLGNNNIRKITPQGMVSTFAGSFNRGNANGQGTAAGFNAPISLAVDISGNVFVADFYNDLIRKITPGGAVSTFSTLPNFTNPYGITVDPSGNIFIVDSNSYIINKIANDGSISTFAGSQTPGNADGQGEAASFSLPRGLASDASGNIYVTDANIIRKITPGGLVSTVAGTNTSGNADGQGSIASFNYPYGIAADANGYLYVADTRNNSIRMITPNGVVTTLAGSATQGSTNGPGSTALFYNPRSITVDAAGNIYVADNYNNLIRKITIGTTTTSVLSKNPNTLAVNVYPNPAKDIITVSLPEITHGKLSITDLQGNEILSFTINDKSIIIPVSAIKNGMYVLRIVSDQNSYISEIVITQ